VLFSGGGSDCLKHSGNLSVAEKTKKVAASKGKGKALNR